MDSSIENGANLDTYDQVMKLAIVVAIALPVIAGGYLYRKARKKSRKLSKRIRKFFRK